MVGASWDIDDPAITTIYYYDGNIAAPNLYPLPSYIGALVDMMADQSASNFRYRTLANGFAVVATLKIPNEALTDAERIETERRLIQRYAGDTGDPLMFLYGVPSTNGEIAYPELEYQPIPDISGVYSEISRDTLFKILLAHQIPPVLAGFTESGGIASEGAAIVAAAKLFELTFAKNARATVCDALRYIVPNPISIEPLDLSSLL
jgi:capsid portal protein